MAVSKDNSPTEVSPLLPQKSPANQAEGYVNGESSDCESGAVEEAPASEARTYSRSFIAKVVIALFIGKCW